MEKDETGQFINKIKLNTQLISAQTDARWGATYHFEDTTIQPDTTYYYAIEDVDTLHISTLQTEFIVEVKPFKPVPATCRLYGVHDEALNNSIFFTYDMNNRTVVQLGELCKGCDIESMDVHPLTDELYVASGNNTFGHPKGYLYQLAPQTGELISIGYTGFEDISGLAFDNQGTLWAWAKGVGLLQLDTQTGQGTLIYEAKEALFDLTWNLESSLLYGVVGSELWHYEPITQAVAKVCDNLPAKTEAIEIPPTFPPNVVLLGSHKNGQLVLHAFDINTCQAVIKHDVAIPYDDPEGLAMPHAACGAS